MRVALVLLSVAVLLVVVLQWRWRIVTQRLHPWLRDHADLLGAYRSLLWLFTLPVIVVGGYLAFLEFQRSLSLPDARLVFGRPKAPVFWIVNESQRTVHDPKYGLLLYNLNIPGNEEPCLNLMIPFEILDFIRPGRASGPYGIQTVSKARQRIESGHDIFGYGQVECPDCLTVRYYWVFVRVGGAGWFAEIEEEEQKAILKNLAEIVHAPNASERLTRIRELVPVERRIGMGNAG